MGGTTATAATTTTTTTPKPKLQTATDGAAHDTAIRSTKSNNDVNPLDFSGAVDSNHDLPTPQTLKRIENYMVLDRDGKSHPFKSLYSGKHVARRVMLIFVRHFFCGQCQEYLRQVSASITPEALLRLPVSTFIAVVGCGDPGLINMYAAATGCPFPIYADPTRKLYDELGMIKTLALGHRPAYATANIIKVSLASVVQGLKQLPRGMTTKAGDTRQVGGEFLFEPESVLSPVGTPWAELERRMGEHQDLLQPRRSRQSRRSWHEGDDGDGGGGVLGGGSDEVDSPVTTTTTTNGQRLGSETSLDGKNEDNEGEEKKVTWCHRMRTTRDHAEIPELMEVLGLDGQGMPIKDKKRWSRALHERKGTGLSMASQISAMKAEAGDLGDSKEGRKTAV